MTWFNTKDKKDPFEGLPEEKKKVAEIIRLMCEHPKTDVRINPNNMSNYLIVNKEKHYDIILDSTGVHITNTNHTTTERFEDKFLNSLKKCAEKRTKEDAAAIESEILRRKNDMFERMKTSLTK